MFQRNDLAGLHKGEDHSGKQAEDQQKNEKFHGEGRGRENVFYTGRMGLQDAKRYMAACPERAARNRRLKAVPAVDFMRGVEWAKAAQETFAGKRPEGAPPGSPLPRLSRVDVLRNGSGRFFLEVESVF
ncbi:hypothetical protein CE91St26_00610 [Akkermansia muciniphila]|nr:hypothetical protein CE91St26_00610 [Akkermansia muciniphila]GKI07979.1 hypothetical protein CE91St27_00610 [Akkermansia muciniphila]